MELIEHPPILHIPAIPDHVLYTWIVMGILVVLSIVATRRVSLVPTGTQNFMELVLDQFVKELDETIGHEGRRYLPLIATLGLFILVLNAGCFWLVSAFVPGFHVAGFWPALGGALLVSVVSWVGTAFVSDRGRVVVITRRAR